MDPYRYISSVLPLPSLWACNSSTAPAGKCDSQGWIIHMLFPHRIEAHTQENVKLFSNEETFKALLNSLQPQYIIERLRSAL